jgi:uncharacterized membrane protein
MSRSVSPTKEAAITAASSSLSEPRLDNTSGIFMFPLAIVGFLVGLGIAHLAEAENGSKFTSTSQFKVWSAMTGAFVAVAVVIFPYSVAILRRLRSRFPKDANWPRLIAVYTAFMGLTILVTVVFGSPDTSLVANYDTPRSLFLIIGLVAGAPSIMGIWLIESALARVKDRIEEAKEAKAKEAREAKETTTQKPETRAGPEAQILSDLMLARTKLLALLLAFGSLIGVAVLATGALRQAVLAVKTSDGKAAEYPIEYVLIFGLFYSALLAIIYVPAYFRLQDRSRDYIELVFPLPAKGHYTDEEYKDRDNLGKMLHIDASLQETFQTGLAIIGPLLATLVSVLLPKSK